MATAEGSPSVFTRYRDELLLIGVGLLTLIPAIFVADMIRRAWESSPLTDSLNAVLVGFNASSVAAAVLGFYLATLALLYIDSKKRAQAILIFVATVVSLVVLAVNGIFLDEITVAEVVLAIGGFALGIVLIGGQQLRYLQLSDSSEVLGGRLFEGRGQAPLEFPRAERVLMYTLAGFVLLSFFEAHTDYPQLLSIDEGTLIIHAVLDEVTLVGMDPQTLALDVVASGMFLGAFRWFMGYDAEKSVFVLGPSGSGKTHLITGLYIEAQEHGMRPRNASDELVRQVSRMIEQGGFIQQRTRRAMDLSFEYTAGRYFPKNVELDAFDYPGEYLPHIPAGLDVLHGDTSEYEYERIIRDQVDQGIAIDQSKGVTTGSQSSGDRLSPDGGQEPSEGIDEQSAADPEPAPAPEQSPGAVLDVSDEAIRDRAQIMVEEVCPRIDEAEVLLLAVDMARILGDETDTLDTEWYNNILSRMPDDTEVILVTTKTDLLMAEDVGVGAQTWQSPEGFRDHVDGLLREHMGAGGISVAEKPYPVYYQTYEDDGERKMAFGDTGASGGSTPGTTGSNPRPQLYGFKNLLDRMGR